MNRKGANGDRRRVRIETLAEVAVVGRNTSRNLPKPE
jgi:hypothetical protein